MLVFLVLVGILLPIFAVPSTASAAGITASFVDAAHIYLNIPTGTTTTVNGVKIDLSNASSLFIDGDVEADGQDWTLSNPLSQGNHPKFWNIGGNTCSTNQNDISLNSWNPGGNSSATAYISEPDTAQGNSCSQVQISITVTDLAGPGGTLNNTLEINGGSPYGTVTKPAGASTTLFYENGNQILEAGDDPSYSQNNGQSEWVFSDVGKGVFAAAPSSDDDYSEGSLNGDVNCSDVDYISNVGASSTAKNNIVTATYYSPGGGGGCNTQKPNTYPILVLDETPEAASQSENGGGGSASGSGSVANVQDDCPISEWGLRWFVCPIITAIDQAVAPIDAILDKFLTFPEEDFNASSSPGSAYYLAWGDFRDIAVSLLVLAALIMVIGQSMGLDLLDAYSIRKILPRLLLAAVLLSISWPLMAYVVGFFNDLGNWIGDIILYPFQGLYPRASALTPVGIAASIAGDTTVGIAAIAAALTASAALDIIGVITLLLSLLLALVVAFVSLMIREMIIILCVITAPVAIVMYILPTTQRFWRFWRDALISALLMFPIIAAFLAAGRVLAILFAVQGGVTVLLAPVAIIVSYFMLGTAFRLAGGLAAQAHGLVNGFHSGAFKGLSSYRRKKVGQQLHNAQSGHLLRGTNRASNWVNKRAQGAVLVGKRGVTLDRRQRQARGRAAAGEHDMDRAKEIMEDKAFTQLSQDDNKLRAFEETIGAGAETSGLGTGRQGVESSLLSSKFRGRVAGRINAGLPANAQRDASTFTLDEIRNGLSEDEQLELNDDTAEVMSLKKKYGNSRALAWAATAADLSTNTRWRDDVVIDPVTGERTVIHNAGGHFLQSINDASRDENGVVNTTLATNLEGLAKRNMGARGEISKASFGDMEMTRRRLEAGEYAVDPATGAARTRQQQLEAAAGDLTRSAYDGTNAYERLQGQKPYTVETFADFEVANVQQLANVQRQAEANLQTALNAAPAAPATPPYPPTMSQAQGAAWLAARTPAQVARWQATWVTSATPADRTVWQGQWQRRQPAVQAAEDALQDASRRVAHAMSAIQHEQNALGGAATMNARTHADRVENIEFQDPLSREVRNVQQGIKLRRDGVRQRVIVNVPIMDPADPTGRTQLVAPMRVGGPAVPQFRREERIMTVVPPDDAYNQSIKEWSAAEAGQANVGGPGAPTGGPPSDRRLKNNLKHIATTAQGIKLYSFQYIWSEQYYVGVIAQDLLLNFSYAVQTDKNGFYAVNYDLLGLKMITLDKWNSVKDSYLDGQVKQITRQRSISTL